MIIVTVKSTPKPEYAEHYVQAVTEIAPLVRSEQGCLQYELFRSCEAPGQFILFERWASRTDLDRHLATSRMEAFKLKAAPFFASERTISMYSVDD